MFKTRPYLRRRVWWAWLLLLAFLPQWMMKTLHHHGSCAHDTCTAVQVEQHKYAQVYAHRCEKVQTQTQQQTHDACAQHQHSEQSGTQVKEIPAEEGGSAHAPVATQAADRTAIFTQKTQQEVCPLCDFVFFPTTAAVDFDYNFSIDYHDAIAIAPSYTYVSAQEKAFYLRGPPTI